MATTWRCEDCGWTCSANPYVPLEEAECDNCGGELVATEPPARYTAAISTHDVPGDYCDVAVIKNDDDGDLTDEVAFAATELPVRIDDPDVLGKVEDAAEKALAQAGWQVYGPWRVAVADYALYADAEVRADA